MNDTELEEAREGMESVREMFEVGADIVAAERGDERKLEELQQPRTIEAEFPGNRTRAMGHALVTVEKLEGLGIEAEREYVGEVEDFPHHRINIHIAGGDSEPAGSEAAASGEQ